MNSIQKQINHLCYQLGKNHLIVQGAGGNVSWKDKDVLWIKASGTWLAQANEKNIFVPVDLAEIKNKIFKNDFEIKIKALEEGSLRPSIETILHAMMPQKYVVHLHPVDIFTLMIQAEMEWLTKINQDLLFKNPIILDYVQPGVTLAKLLHQHLDVKKQQNLVFLKNHGIIYGANDIEELHDSLVQLFKIFSTDSETILVKDTSEQQMEIVLNTHSYSLLQSEKLNQLVMNNDLYDLIEKNWAICPDHIVFLGANAYCTEQFSELHIDKSEVPQIIFVKNQGVYVHQNWTVAQEVQLQFFYEVLRRLPRHSKISVLNTIEISKLLNWDEETYRKNLKY
jgi:rhamnose utilization protein RhaD (predicted bifunctional aldolase and dehydrogenase)